MKTKFIKINTPTRQISGRIEEITDNHFMVTFEGEYLDTDYDCFISEPFYKTTGKPVNNAWFIKEGMNITLDFASFLTA